MAVTLQKLADNILWLESMLCIGFDLFRRSRVLSLEGSAQDSKQTALIEILRRLPKDSGTWHSNEDAGFAGQSHDGL